MLTISLVPDVTAKLTAALKSAGVRECGGVLMAEHVGHNHFVVREITVQRRGTFARFVREVRAALSGIKAFFDRTAHQYGKYNYLGEWHSHPSFVPEPSGTDHASMHEIIDDPDVGATFVVLIIVKLDAQGHLVGSAHTYLPGGAVHRSDLLVEKATS